MALKQIVTLKLISTETKTEHKIVIIEETI